MNSVQPLTLLGRVREAIRYKHYSIRTERTYVEWVRRFVRFHGQRHPRDMGAPEVRSFLGHLASEAKVAASTHQQALSALLFLYKEVLGVNLPWLTELDRPKKPKRLPVVLGHAEVERLLTALDGTHALMAQLPLSYLRLSPHYAARIDQQAVHDEMRQVIERAHLQGLQVIGQHVEDPQTAAKLWLSGIDYIQGDLVQRAADAMDFDFQSALL